MSCRWFWLLSLAASFTVQGLAQITAGPPFFPPVPGWSVQPDSTVYTRSNLYELIDGAADLFLSYDFQQLRLARYRDAGPDPVRVEIYRHGSRSNAFGMYSQERSPGYRFIEIGTQGYIEDGVLNFLSGVCYVKISTDRQGKSGRDAMVHIAQAVDTMLEQKKGWPPELALFPGAGKVPNSETYVHRGFLGYSALHSAFVAEYETQARFRAFLIALDSPDSIKAMAGRYFASIGTREALVDGKPMRVQDPNNGSILILGRDRFLWGILGCSEREVEERLVEEMDRTVRDSQRRMEN